MKLLKRISLFEILLITVILSVHLYAATSDAYNFPNKWFTRDDAYYYFKVAQNITEGRGSTFDGVSPTNGYHPLWMLVNIPIFALARFDLILPLRILLIVQAALTAATAILIYRLVKSALSPPVAMVASAWWAFNPYMHSVMTQVGLETGLAAFAVILLIYQLWKFETTWRETPLTLKHVAGLAIVATLTLFSRLDLVFLSVLAGVWIILRGTRLRTLLPLDMLVAVISVLSSFVFRLGLPEYYTYSRAAMVMVALSVTTKIVLYFFLGLYQTSTAESFWVTARKIFIGMTVSTLITSGVMLIVPLGGFPRSALIYDAILNLLGMLSLRWLARVFSQNAGDESISPLEFLKSSWREWGKEGVIFYGILGGALALYMLANKVFIGSAMPVSGQIKHWWSTFSGRAYGGSARNFLSFWGLDFQTDFNTLNPFSKWLGRVAVNLTDMRAIHLTKESSYIVLLVIVFILWLVILLLNRRQAVTIAAQFGLPILLTAGIFQVLSYNLTGYAGIKEWYWITQPILLVLAFSLAAHILIQPLQKYPIVKIATWIIVAAIILPQARSFAVSTIKSMPQKADHSALSAEDMVRFLEENTPPGSMIGMTGGGTTAYFIQGRTIVNLDGLINSPDYFTYMKAGDANTYLKKIGLDYVFANTSMLRGAPYKGQIGIGSVLDQFDGKALMEFIP
ncbi:MAG: hypothetical protein HZB50_05585 [Chloroflexi bacterium]|nr:hypothetical protein [Chloroflexota bacterium]